MSTGPESSEMNKEDPLLQDNTTHLSFSWAVFALVSTATGAECLSLPNMMSNSGIALHLLILVVVATVAYLSIVAIAEAADHYKTYHFSGLVRKALGLRCGIAADFIVIIETYGTITGYQILVGTLLPNILDSFGIHDSTGLARDLSMVSANLLILIPLGMFRNLSALRFVSVVSVVAIAYIAIVLIAELKYFNHHYSQLKYFDVNQNVFVTYAVTLYAFICHTNVPGVHSELANKSGKQMSKVGLLTIVIVLCGNILIAVFGYLSVPENTPSIITQRDTPPGINNDWAMVAGRVIFCATILIAIPIYAPPFRNSLAKFFFKKDELTKRMHALVTIGLMLSTMGIAIAYPNITLVFDFLGGFNSTILVILIPGLLHYRVSNKSWKSPSNLLVLGSCVFLTVAGFVAVGVYTYDLTNSSEDL